MFDFMEKKKFDFSEKSNFSADQPSLKTPEALSSGTTSSFAAGLAWNALPPQHPLSTLVVQRQYLLLRQAAVVDRKFVQAALEIVA